MKIGVKGGALGAEIVGQVKETNVYKFILPSIIPLLCYQPSSVTCNWAGDIWFFKVLLFVFSQFQVHSLNHVLDAVFRVQSNNWRSHDLQLARSFKSCLGAAPSLLRHHAVAI
jgi:hypothetical protein